MASKAVSAILEQGQVNSEAYWQSGSSLLEEDLIRRAKQGEPWAANELFKRYYQKGFQLAYILCSEDKEEAKDALQEAFIKAFQNLNSFRENSKFYTWFYRILVNTCLDKKRASGRWKRLFSFWPTRERSEKDQLQEFDPPDNTQGSDPLVAVQNKELGLAVHEAINRLPDKQKLVFHLKIIEGMKIREVAQVMGAAEGTVKTHLFRAIQNLQKALEIWI